jgi:eukaryotic-like serine/threonine-protein kinase
VAGEDTGTKPPTLAETTILAMHAEEAARSASFGRVVAMLCAVGLVLTAIDGTRGPLRFAMVGALAYLGSIGTWAWWRSRTPERYSRFVFRIFGVSAAFAALVFMHYQGVFSSVPVVVVLGFAFFGQADDFKWLFPVSLSVVVAYVASAILITAHVIPDVGIFSPKDVSLVQRISMIVMVTAVMLMQLLQSRMSRRATLDAIRRAQEAVRVARTREAQLDEAKENLDAALKAGAGKGGRFTGAIVGRFRLEEIVGRGAMGEVYAARAEPGGFRAAVKLLHLARRDDPELVKRFVREAQIAQRVRGPNLVEVYEASSAPDGSAFIAMELLVGSDLAALLRERNTLPLIEVVTLIDDVARGLDTLHAAGVVHRDLKPQNLFLALGPPPAWKILDYGVAKIWGDATLTQGQLIGTPGYMSPEQAQGETVDPRSDVFALGAVAYRALTGRRPFSGADTPQILYKIVYSAPVRPRELAPHVPRDVEIVLAIALAKAKEQRFPNATGFAMALRLAAAGALDPATRAMGERIVRATPWGRDLDAVAREHTAVAVPAPRRPPVTARGRP